MRRAQARQSYIFRYVVILLRVYWRKVTRARRTASADWWITPGTAGMRPRDLFTTSRDYRESVGSKELRSYLVSHDTTRFFYLIPLTVKLSILRMVHANQAYPQEIANNHIHQGARSVKTTNTTSLSGSLSCNGQRATKTFLRQPQTTTDRHACQMSQTNHHQL
ncbi:hypothetical protein EVAR_8811_1 [Eumeta japonica]|uniref:Uncharacterized protein n=1 Tax=Eumeta variegata TaxID=151549 RepID=A0A4C1TTX6_EUMVA|nr:hypothetical protein EVAR_8811_1 [Eumeta japonica]